MGRTGNVDGRHLYFRCFICNGANVVDPIKNNLINETDNICQRCLRNLEYHISRKIKELDINDNEIKESQKYNFIINFLKYLRLLK